MSIFNIRAAIFSKLEELALDIPVFRANERKPQGVNKFAEAFILPNAPEPATMGDTGRDRIVGILQINVNVPLNEGDGELLQLCDVFAQAFRVGLDLTYNNQEVAFFGGGVSGFQESNGLYQAILSFEFESQYSRT